MLWTIVQRTPHCRLLVHTHAPQSSRCSQKEAGSLTPCLVSPCITAKVFRSGGCALCKV